MPPFGEICAILVPLPCKWGVLRRQLFEPGRYGRGAKLTRGPQSRVRSGARPLSGGVPSRACFSYNMTKLKDARMPWWLASVNKVHHLFTIKCVAGMFGEDEDWLGDVANEMDQEDGLI
jgi:hypothetical protein